MLFTGLALGACCTAAALVTLSRVVGFGWIVRNATLVDVVFTVGMCVLFFGTSIGMIVGIIAGLFMALFLSVAKWFYGAGGRIKMACAKSKDKAEKTTEWLREQKAARTEDGAVERKPRQSPYLRYLEGLEAQVGAQVGAKAGAKAQPSKAKAGPVCVVVETSAQAQAAQRLSEELSSSANPAWA